MDEQNQKERLEQELKFLKESFEAEVISKEEFEKGKGRVEKGLQEINEKQQKEGTISQEKAEKWDTNPETRQNEEKEAAKNLNEEKIAAKAETDEAVEKSAEKTEEPEPEKKEDDRQKSDKPKESRAFKYTIVFVVLVLVAFFAYSLVSKNKATENGNNAVLTFACYGNEECVQNGVNGICTGAGTKDAKCELIQQKKTKVIVLNDRIGCFNCDTQRVLGILEGWFGDLEVEEIGYNTAAGKEFAESIGAEMLPSYSVYDDLSQNQEFDTFSRAFTQKGDSYVLSSDAAASTFYIKRESIPGRLGLFAKKWDAATAKAENNIEEFLDAFPGIDFEIHYADDALTKELGIRTFPTFLINNKVKFSGIYPAETVKENFCSLNDMDGCDKELSANLI